jgi:hypothetical protein
VGSVGLSALAALLVGSIRFTAQALLATLAWVLTCTSLTWFRGADADWIRWGLDGHFTPTTEGPLAWLASRIAGLWFFLLFGATLVYPLSYLTRWGVVTYLWCRPTPRLGGADAVDLSDEERTDLLDQQIARQRKKKR